MNPTQRTIVIASDDTKIREMARSASMGEGYQPIMCGDGKEALESIQNLASGSTPAKLIVLEAFLPKLDGYEIARQLEDIPNTGTVPILMLIEQKDHGVTPGSARRPTAVQAATKIRLNADDYLQKPFQLEEIQARIHSMTKHFRSHNAPHPVTGLPGHPQLEQKIFAQLNRGESLGLVCMDINHFRPFNDHYGTDKGNEVIRMIVELIQKTAKSLNIPDQQMATLTHINGDDFAILVTKEEADDLRQKLRQEFKTGILRFYSKDEGKKGFFYGKDRQQKDQIFPVMNLCTASLDITPEKFAHYGEVVSEMNEILRQSKVGSQDV